MSECNIEKTDNVNIKIRNNAIINLVLSCGLRVSEVANLNLSDFKFDLKGVMPVD